jgi:hypothetical protein
VYQDTVADSVELAEEHETAAAGPEPENAEDVEQVPGALRQIGGLFDGTPALARAGVRGTFKVLARGNKVLIGRLKVWWRSDRGPHTVVLVVVGGLLYLFPEGMGTVAAAGWVVAAFANGRKPVKDDKPVKPPKAQTEGEQEPDAQAGAAGHGPQDCDDDACDLCFEDDAPAAPVAQQSVDMVKASPPQAPLSDDEMILRVTEHVVAEAPARGERGAHVAQILARLKAVTGRFPVWKTADLANRLRELGVPVERQLKVGGSPLPGVRYDQLQQWLGRLPAIAPDRVPDVTARD